MPRAKTKKKEEDKEEQGEQKGQGEEERRTDPQVRVAGIEAVITRVLPVTIYGQLLVAKPVDPAVALILSPYSPVPPRKGGEWSNREKADNKKRERKRWKLGKRGHYKISLDQLKMSHGPGYGIPSGAIMRAIQTANRIMPQHQVDEELLSIALEVPSHDVEKSLLRVIAKRGPFMKEDGVRVGHKPENNMKGTPSWTVRPAWIDWKISFDILFTQNLIDGEQVFNLLMWAGRAGILEGRPSKKSALNWGRFSVKSGVERLSKIE